MWQDPRVEPREGAPPRTRRPDVVTVLALVLGLLLTIWIVGAVLLVRYSDSLPVDPRRTPSPSAPTEVLR